MIHLTCITLLLWLCIGLTSVVAAENSVPTSLWTFRKCYLYDGTVKKLVPGSDVSILGAFQRAVGNNPHSLDIRLASSDLKEFFRMSSDKAPVLVGDFSIWKAKIDDLGSDYPELTRKSALTVEEESFGEERSFGVNYFMALTDEDRKVTLTLTTTRYNIGPPPPQERNPASGYFSLMYRIRKMNNDGDYVEIFVTKHRATKETVYLTKKSCGKGFTQFPLTGFEVVAKSDELDLDIE